MAECIIVGNNGGGGGSYEFTMSNNGYFQYPADVVVPANVTTLGAGNSAGGFYNHTEIETITFEDASKITALSNNMCDGCTSLTTFEIPPNITSIDNYAFRNTAITNITIPANITNIGQYAFYGCPVTNIMWNTSDSSVKLGNYAFSHSGITDVGVAQVLAKGSSFGHYLFEYCDNLVNVTVANSANYMFRNCTNLESITINNVPNHRTGASLCSECSSLKTAFVSSGITTVDNYAFDKCGALENVTLPETLTTIGTYAFRNCTSLQAITLPSSITSINANSFNGCKSLTNIVLGTDWNCACSFSDVTTLTEESLAGMFNSLKDLTGASSKTLTIGTTNLNKLTAEEKLIALNKNWNLA